MTNENNPEGDDGSELAAVTIYYEVFVSIRGGGCGSGTMFKTEKEARDYAADLYVNAQNLPGCAVVVRKIEATEI